MLLQTWDRTSTDPLRMSAGGGLGPDPDHLRAQVQPLAPDHALHGGQVGHHLLLRRRLHFLRGALPHRSPERWHGDLVHVCEVTYSKTVFSPSCSCCYFLFFRIGGILCPYLNQLGEYWSPLPLIVYGSLSLSAGLMALKLPETLNKKLPDTLLQGEEFA